MYKNFFLLILLFMFPAHGTQSKKNYKSLKNICNAIQRQDTLRVQHILKKDPCIAQRSRYGKVPLLNIATVSGNFSIISLLLHYGASLKKGDFLGQTPVHIAALLNKPFLIKLYHQKGAPLDQPNNAGATPTHLAAEQNHIATLRALFNLNAPKEPKDIHGNTPLLIATSHKNFEAVAFLLRHGAHVNATNDDLETPLHLAIKEDNDHLVACLLQHGALINAKNIHQATPLLIAAHRKRGEITRLLLARHADVNQANTSGITPLMTSIITKSGIHQTLLKHTPDCSLRDAHNRTAFDWAIIRGYQEGLRDLLKYDRTYNQLSEQQKKDLFFFAAQKGKKDLLELLLEYGIDKTHDPSLILELVKTFVHYFKPRRNLCFFPCYLHNIYSSIFFFLQKGANPDKQEIMELLCATINSVKGCPQTASPLYELLRLLLLYGLHPDPSYIHVVEKACSSAPLTEVLRSNTSFFSFLFPLSPSVDQLHSKRLLYRHDLTPMLLFAIGQANVSIVSRLLRYADPDSKLAISFDACTLKQISPYDLIQSILRQKNNTETLQRILTLLSSRIRLEFNFLYKTLQGHFPHDIIFLIFQLARDYPDELMLSIYLR